jgi:hypothetical protein
MRDLINLVLYDDVYQHQDGCTSNAADYFYCTVVVAYADAYISIATGVLTVTIITYQVSTVTNKDDY